jgi:hypothetical protein
MSVYRPKNSPHRHFDFIWKGHRLYGGTGETERKEATFKLIALVA